MAKTFFILKAGIAPPDLASQPEYVRLQFWQIVVEVGLRRKDWELARGLNARGEPLPGVAPATRKHRRSAMTPSGRGDPSAPYLMPGRGLSRTRSLLTGKAHADYAEFFWRFDAHTGDQWGRVLAWHAARGRAYDVVGLSPAGVASVAREAQRQWRRRLSPPVLGVAPVIDHRQRPAAAQGPGTPLGRTNLTHAVFGIGGSKEQAQRAIDEGRSSGFRTQAEWRRYFRQQRPVGPLASPATTAPSVRAGASNVLLRHVWGGPPKPPAVMARAALPPTAPPPMTVPRKPVTVPPAAAPPAFPPSTATIAYGGPNARERQKSERAARRVFKGIPPEEYASVIGAPDGARVTIDGSASGNRVTYEVKHPDLRDMRGEVVLYEDLRERRVWHEPSVLYVEPSRRGKGVGATVHGRRVAYGAKHGLTTIRIHAARGSEEIGYIVWPAMGYDGPLPDSIRKILPDPLKGRTTIQELLADAEGQKWWKEKGVGIDVKFSLQPGSPSIMRWATYWARRLLRPGR